jgi:hypothetical protein
MLRELEEWYKSVKNLSGAQADALMERMRAQDARIDFESSQSQEYKEERKDIKILRLQAEKENLKADKATQKARKAEAETREAHQRGRELQSATDELKNKLDSIKKSEEFKFEKERICNEFDMKRTVSKAFQGLRTRKELEKEYLWQKEQIFKGRRPEELTEEEKQLLEDLEDIFQQVIKEHDLR